MFGFGPRGGQEKAEGLESEESRLHRQQEHIQSNRKRKLEGQSQLRPPHVQHHRNKVRNQLDFTRILAGVDCEEADFGEMGTMATGGKRRKNEDKRKKKREEMREWSRVVKEFDIHYIHTLAQALRRGGTRASLCE